MSLTSESSQEKLSELRQLMKRENLDGLLVPKSDEYMSEYLAPYAERLRWLTGFTGSSASCIIFKDKAAFFTDSRYEIQVLDEVDINHFEIHIIHKKQPKDWLKENLNEGMRIGFDPWLHTIASIGQLTGIIEKNDAICVPIPHNLIDELWSDKPAKPMQKLKLHDEKYAGQSAKDKLATLQINLNEEHLSHFVITACDSLAWVFNIRGSDVDFTPLVHGFAIISAEGMAKIFIDKNKVSDEAENTLKDVVEIYEADVFLKELARCAAQSKQADRSVGLDKNQTVEAIHASLKSAGGNIKFVKDFCQTQKAVKNPIEIEGMRKAHCLDGLAITRLLYWLDMEVQKGTRLDELSIVNKLAGFRENVGALGPSFETISGSGPNGAIVHYRVDKTSNRILDQDNLLLVDSGGQYEMGTTDITRTIAIGEPSAEMRENFTRVLKGHLQLANAIFPRGMTGARLDTLARAALWQAGLDFDHGTGHGVGAYLGVHESPPLFRLYPNRYSSPDILFPMNLDIIKKITTVSGSKTLFWSLR